MYSLCLRYFRILPLHRTEIHYLVLEQKAATLLYPKYSAVRESPLASGGVKFAVSVMRGVRILSVEFEYRIQYILQKLLHYFPFFFLFQSPFQQVPTLMAYW